MKIIVFGATGNTGKRVLAQGVQLGHEMTAFVRNPEKLYEQQGGQIAGQVKVIAQDIMDPDSVYEALAHQDAAILAAGHAGQGEEFVRIVDNIVSQCENHPRFSGRVWLMGGAGLLDIPYTDLFGNNLPGFPPMFKYHNRNLDRLRQTRLDWSVMCPGKWSIRQIILRRLQELEVAYEDVAKMMLNHLDLAGAFKGKRVGLAYRSEMPIH